MPYLITMIVSIHQPNYLPYLGFFNKIKNSDLFILFDTAQYVKNDFHNRNRIKTPQGEIYLTIPIASKDCYLKRICDVPLPDDKSWALKHWKSIELNYKKTKYFEKYSSFFRDLYSNPPTMLIKLNESIIRYLLDAFGIKTKIIKASNLDINYNLKSNDLLIDILKKVRATEYISGKGRGGEHYVDVQKFESAGIKFRFQEFTHPIYLQQLGEFIPNMAAIDLLFNVGEKSGDLI